MGCFPLPTVPSLFSQPVLVHHALTPSFSPVAFSGRLVGRQLVTQEVVRFLRPQWRERMKPSHLVEVPACSPDFLKYPPSIVPTAATRQILCIDSHVQQHQDNLASAPGQSRFVGDDQRIRRTGPGSEAVRPTPNQRGAFPPRQSGRERPRGSSRDELHPKGRGGQPCMGPRGAVQRQPPPGEPGPSGVSSSHGPLASPFCPRRGNPAFRVGPCGAGLGSGQGRLCRRGTGLPSRPFCATDRGPALGSHPEGSGCCRRDTAPKEVAGKGSVRGEARPGSPSFQGPTQARQAFQGPRPRPASCCPARLPSIPRLPSSVFPLPV